MIFVRMTMVRGCNFTFAHCSNLQNHAISRNYKYIARTLYRLVLGEFQTVLPYGFGHELAMP